MDAVDRVGVSLGKNVERRERSTDWVLGRFVLGFKCWCSVESRECRVVGKFCGNIWELTSGPSKRHSLEQVKDVKEFVRSILQGAFKALVFCIFLHISA
jgi:hypothetical protein